MEQNQQDLRTPNQRSHPHQNRTPKPIQLFHVWQTNNIPPHRIFTQLHIQTDIICSLVHCHHPLQRMCHPDHFGIQSALHQQLIIPFIQKTPPTSTKAPGTILDQLEHTLDNLQNIWDDLELEGLRLLKLANDTKRQQLNTTLLIPIDHCNTHIHKALSTIHQFSKRLTTPTDITRFNSLTQHLPQAKTTHDLITKWNLSHNSQHSQLDKFWNKTITQQICVDITNILTKTQRKIFLPPIVTGSLNSIFQIECQLLTDALHSTFANFTTLDIATNHKFNGTLSPHPNTQTFYLELISDTENSIDT